MKRAGVFLIALGVALPVLAGNENSEIQGYGYFGVMGADRSNFGKLLQPGLGADVFLYKGLAANVDASYVGYHSDFAADGIGLVSTNGAYHFRKSGKFSPFVTGGYSLAFRSGTSNMGNYGGGFNYWFASRVGLRVEARDYRDANGYHVSGIRFGVTFR
jgi:hypothetical protein